MDWNKIISLIAEIIMLVLSGFVIPWIKSKIDLNKFSKYVEYAKIAVGAAEQIAENEGYDCAWKKEYVVDYVTKQFPGLEAETVDNIIENAVILLHNELYGTLVNLSSYATK